MKRTLSAVISSCCFVSGAAFAQAFEADVKSLIEANCIRCHDAETKTPLNMEKLDYDLANPGAFRRMVRIFDRLEGREVCASSSNRNFKGRQGSPTGRTLLMSPAMVVAAAIAGEVTDVREALAVQP